MPWDSWSFASWPLCTKIEEIALIEEEYFYLGSLTRQEVINATSCALPCRFTEFRIVGSLAKGFNHGSGLVGLQLAYARSTFDEEREVFLYDFTSFISEFGGALGLFLGFSFFSCWDISNLLLTALQSKAGLNTSKI